MNTIMSRVSKYLFLTILDFFLIYDFFLPISVFEERDLQQQ